MSLQIFIEACGRVSRFCVDLEILLGGEAVHHEFQQPQKPRSPPTVFVVYVLVVSRPNVRTKEDLKFVF